MWTLRVIREWPGSADVELTVEAETKKEACDKALAAAEDYGEWDEDVHPADAHFSIDAVIRVTPEGDASDLIPPEQEELLASVRASLKREAEHDKQPDDPAYRAHLERALGHYFEFAVEECQAVQAAFLADGTWVRTDPLTYASEATVKEFTDPRGHGCVEEEVKGWLAAHIAGRDKSMDEQVCDLLAKQKRIALIWAIEDVLRLRPDLTAEQAWEVLQAVESEADALVGVTWDTLEECAERLFGDGPDDDENEEEDE
jgi:hypothetical protein